MPEQKTWWRNLQGGGAVQLILQGKAREGEAALLDPQTQAAEMTDGLRVYLRRFPSLA